jgi:hypothetical protein
MLESSIMRNLLNDPRLSAGERRYLESIAQKLSEPPRQPLPPEYERELARVYGGCCGEEGDLEGRGE